MAEAGLDSLLKSKRQELLDRWSATTRRDNTADAVSHTQLLDQIPVFVDELISALNPEAIPLPSIGETAIEHGGQRLSLGFNVAEVVREYGHLHRCIIEIAAEGSVVISVREHTVIAKWLNAGIANAVSQYVTVRDGELHRQTSEHLGFIAHEIRNPLSSASMAFRLLQGNLLASGGRVVQALERNLRRTLEVIDNALGHASLRMGLAPRIERLELRPFFEELESETGAEAQAKNIELRVTLLRDIAIDADPRLLRSAVSNLIHNAIKFSAPKTTVELRVKPIEGRVLIEVEDGCGGLPPGRAEDLFLPLVQRGADQSGFGLGLAIALQAAQAHNGTVTVHDLPGKGCVFTIDLPAKIEKT
jgi:signal transduction histidine kinase